MVLDVQDGLVYELSVTAFVDAYAVADFEQVLKTGGSGGHCALPSWQFPQSTYALC